MSGVRWLLIAALAVAFALFAAANWTPVALVFGSTEVVTRLPLVVLAAFLLAFVPMSLRYRWARSRWTTRLLRDVPPAPLADATLDKPPCAPSLAQPIAVPPAGA